MLTGKMVRVRYSRDRLLPYYLDTHEESWRMVAEQLLELYRGMIGHTRGELEDLIDETFGDEGTLVHRGLAKLLEDRCEFETAAGHPPEQLRARVFRLATFDRLSEEASANFDRQVVLQKAAAELSLPVEEIASGLFADLKSEQKLIRFDDLSPEHLLERYNVALAQAILLRAVRVDVTLTGEPPQRYRQLLRQIKFHRLICEIERVAHDSHILHLDGPLSLFSSTQKYGLQMAMFLPSVLHCRHFEVRAELRWGTQKKPKQLQITPKDRLVSHAPDFGMFVPPELQLFVSSFRKRISDWELIEETDVYPLGQSFWVPDFRLVHRPSGRIVKLEVLGFWRKSSAIRHLQLLRQFIHEPFLLAVSDQLHIDEHVSDLPAGIHRFRNMPLADEIARLAAEVIVH